jgi:diketogulonate reductase-like aldo/keto reductase
VGLTTRREFGAGACAAMGAAFVPASRSAKAKPMITREIPSTREAIPVVGMGTWQTFDVASPRERESLQPVLQAFSDAGGTVIDSSPMYGRAEETVGDLLPAMKGGDRAFVATKVWTRGREAGFREMKRSIRRMGGRVDLMQVHNLLDYGTHIQTLRRWKEEGTIRYIGVTHYELGAFDELERIIERDGVDFVQLPYSIGLREAEKRLLPAAQNSNTAVLVMRPFEEGRVFQRVKGKALPSFAAEIDCDSWAQFFLKFILGHPAVTCPIPATANVRHMRDNMRAGLGRLPDEAMRRRMLEAYSEL